MSAWFTTKIHLASTGGLILALTVMMCQVTEAKPKAVAMGCISATWPGVHTPEMDDCANKGLIDQKAYPNDLQKWHVLVCYSDGTAKCCHDSVCESVNKTVRRPGLSPVPTAGTAGAKQPLPKRRPSPGTLSTPTSSPPM